MNCELAHERIVLAAYGELPDEQAHELDRHIVGCPECSQEQQQLLALKTLATAYPVISEVHRRVRGKSGEGAGEQA